MSDKLVVLGGNGLIGARVCEMALRCGWSVVSVARRGPPPFSALWMREVFWHTADVLAPEHWAHHLTGAAAVICCVGTRRESPRQGVTYQRVNGDAAILAAECAARARVHTFALMSAAEKPPLTREEFLSSKRRAELAVQKLPLRVVLMRPSLVVDAARPLSLAFGSMMHVAALVPSLRASGRVHRPLEAAVVARAAVRAVNDPTVAGILAPDEIEELGA